MPKKQVTSSVKHSDLEKIKNKYKEMGIRIFTYEKISNPLTYKLHMIYKKVNPQPENEIERDLIRSSIEDLPELRFETWDMSRRDEQQYDRKAYMLVTETDNEDKIVELINKITDIEHKYSLKKEEIQKKFVYAISD
ncbi:MAG: hypothetical protein MUO82_02560 [Candidatus Thermoplasmatota archaeon]|nr:hypothetical protein [Candidatus Thermoplasmatota archaeon]